MIPFPSALEAFLVFWSLIPLPFRAFFVTFTALFIGIKILTYFATR